MNDVMNEAQRLRALAAWYRDFAERAGASWIWQARLRHADALERQADELEMRATRADPSATSRAVQGRMRPAKVLPE